MTTKRTRVPASVFADWNLTVAEVAAIAEQIGGELIHGRGPDHGIGRDVTVVKVTSPRSKYGSDHHYPLIVDLDVPIPGTARSEQIRVLWWNVWVGQKPADVRAHLEQLLEAHQPDLVGLAEAYRCRDVLRQIEGYRLHHGRNVGERADVAVLVAHELQVLHHGRLHLARTWIGPKHGRRKSPRVSRRVQVRLPGGARIRVLFGHAPTGGYDGRNAAAVREWVRRTVRWANQPGTPSTKSSTKGAKS